MVLTGTVSRVEVAAEALSCLSVAVLPKLFQERFVSFWRKQGLFVCFLFLQGKHNTGSYIKIKKLPKRKL